MSDLAKMRAEVIDAQRRLVEPGVVTFASILTIDLALVMASGKEVTRAVSAEIASLYLQAVIELAKQADARQAAERDLKECWATYNEDMGWPVLAKEEI